MASYADLGQVRAWVASPTNMPPDDKRAIWLEQYDNLDTTKHRKKVWSFETETWQLLSDFQDLFEFVEIEVQNDGEAIFTLPKICTAPERSNVSVSGLGFLTYGTNYTISGNTLTFIPNITHGLVLSENDIISVLYYF